MLIYFDINRKILRFDDISLLDAEKIMDKRSMCSWYSGEFDFSMGEDKDGYFKEFYLDDDNTIRIEYQEAFSQPESAQQPTEQEILQAEILLNQQQIINRQNEQDVVLAELLLNQQGV